MLFSQHKPSFWNRQKESFLYKQFEVIKIFCGRCFLSILAFVHTNYTSQQELQTTTPIHSEKIDAILHLFLVVNGLVADLSLNSLQSKGSCFGFVSQ